MACHVVVGCGVDIVLADEGDFDEGEVRNTVGVVHHARLVGGRSGSARSVLDWEV